MAIDSKKKALNKDDLRSKLRVDISDDMLDAVAGGNDDVKGKDSNGWWSTCPGCQAQIWCVQNQDLAKHYTKDCPANPYKTTTTTEE